MNAIWERDDMTDRELLELAAQAANISIDKAPSNGGGRNNNGFDMLGNAVLDWHNGVTWNPLEDDGDALRLAVKLLLMISFTGAAGQCVSVGQRLGRVFHEELSSGAMQFEADCAATRRAIVCAAAEIGKRMKTKRVKLENSAVMYYCGYIGHCSPS